MTTNEEKVLSALTILLDSDLREHIYFSIDQKQNVPIRVSFRDKLLAGESETFSQEIRRLALDYEKIGNTLTDRILEDQSVKKKSIGKSLSSTRLFVAAISSFENVNQNFTDVAEFKDKKLAKD